MGGSKAPNCVPQHVRGFAKRKIQGSISEKIFERECNGLIRMKCGVGAAKIYRLRWFKNMPGRFSGGRALESILRLYLRFRPKAGRLPYSLDCRLEPLVRPD
jgi:hypothetical protein